MHGDRPLLARIENAVRQAQEATPTRMPGGPAVPAWPIAAQTVVRTVRARLVELHDLADSERVRLEAAGASGAVYRARTAAFKELLDELGKPKEQPPETHIRSALHGDISESPNYREYGPESWRDISDNQPVETHDDDRLAQALADIMIDNARFGDRQRLSDDDRVAVADALADERLRDRARRLGTRLRAAASYARRHGDGATEQLCDEVADFLHDQYASSGAAIDFEPAELVFTTEINVDAEPEVVAVIPCAPCGGTGWRETHAGERTCGPCRGRGYLGVDTTGTVNPLRTGDDL